MPKLERFRQYHFDATAKVSDNARTLAVSAIAIVWLFKVEKNGIYTVPNALLIPLALVILGLGLDFFQFLYRSIVWHVIFRSKEKDLQRNLITEETELYVNPWVNVLAYIFFYAKVLVIAVAYFYLGQYFYENVKWS